MMKHTFFSLIRDLRAFLNIINERLRAIESAPLSDIQAEYGVNKLAGQLHPQKLRLSLVSVQPASFGSYLIFKNAQGGELPLFRAGQYIVFFPGVSGIEHARAFFISERTPQGMYKILIPSSSQADIKSIASAKPGAEFISSPPEGTCFYQPLRDGKSLLLCCDKSGFGASEAFASEERGLQTKLFTYFGSAFDSEGDKPQLKVFLREAQKENASVFIYGTAQFVNSLKRLASGCAIERKYIRGCIISPAAELRLGDRKYPCKVKCALGDITVMCSSDYPLSYALEQAGLPCNIRCMSGECGYCRCRLVSGSVKSRFADGEEHIRKADEKYGYIHPCCAYPESELEIEL